MTNLPILTGTARQISYAESVRERALSAIDAALLRLGSDQDALSPLDRNLRGGDDSDYSAALYKTDCARGDRGLGRLPRLNEADRVRFMVSALEQYRGWLVGETSAKEILDELANASPVYEAFRNAMRDE